MSPVLAVVILAGGEGRRMGGSKPLAMLGGERLIERALRHARCWSELVAVSVRSADQLAGLDAPLLPDEPSAAGPLGGLIAALRFAETSGCDFLLTIPADMPFLPADLPARLFAAIGEGGCAIPASGGDRHQDCGLWRTSTLERVAGYLASDRRSLIGFAEFVGFTSVEWPAEPLDPFFNVNTAEDLARAKRLRSEIEYLD
jgi:molybdopterin-guanine dinucleotide biosynthesis protein A